MHITSLCVAVAFTLGLVHAELVRVCVPERGFGPCQEMITERAFSDLNLQCVLGPDKYGCMEKVVAKEADTMTVTGEDVYLARELYDLDLRLVAEMRVKERASEPWRYQAVAVVRRNTIRSVADLNGAKSCHTGYARNTGWNIPFSHLLEMGQIQMQCDTSATVVEHDIKAVNAYFSQACIPGPWVPDNDTDSLLKRRYKNMCALCGQPDVCGRDDPHAGYQGSLTCLVDGGADVAWSKLSVVEEFFRGRSEVASEYGLLCPDGRVLELSSASVKQCRWASRPWNGWLVRSANENNKAIITAITRMVDAAAPPLEENQRSWSNPVLGVWSPSAIHVRPQPVSPRDYLKEHKYDTTIDRLGCTEVPVKLCVESKFSLEKCQALGQVFKSRRIRPGLVCVTPDGGNCLSMVASGGAHITTADGGDVYHAYRDHQLMPIVSERYGLLDASYFAVAVVHIKSNISSLSDLRGKKSCHTGIGRTAGWKIPVVTLLKAGLLKEGDCDFAAQIGNFFSSSCVPGAKDPKYDPKGTNPESLCDLCIGNNVNGAPGPVQGKCDRRPIEAFSGYTGAFRCLVQGGGDVAFIKQTTVGENTNGNNNMSWAANLRSTDFKLLCRNTGAADVVDYNTCNLARVPAHKVIIDPKLSAVMKEEVRILLLRASDEFPPGQDVFKMFGTFKGKQDLIFKDSATALVNIRMDTFHKSLNDSYYETLQKLDECKLESIPLRLTDGNNGAMTLSFVPTYMMLCAALAWLLAH
uniref:Transferrin-like domain-containing protein n=1 Tax=Scylla olivacea TaxID=85551 RepID=A0A0P4WM63_SCYOL